MGGGVTLQVGGCGTPGAVVGFGSSRAHLPTGGVPDARLPALREMAAATKPRRGDLPQAPPRDRAGWLAMFRFCPPLSAARLALHHRELNDRVDTALVAIDADGLEPRVDWVPAYALPTGLSWLAELRLALEDVQVGRPLPLPGDGRCFAVYLVEALEHMDHPSWVDARKPVKMVSPAAPARYLAVVGA